MDPYETLGITPAYEGDLKALRNRLVKRYFEAGEAPDEERMKAINVAYELLSGPARRGRGRPAHDRDAHAARPRGRGSPTGRGWRRRRGGPVRLGGGAAPPGSGWMARARSPGGSSGRARCRSRSRVTDRDGRMAERSLVVHVEPAPLRLVTEALPNATIGVPTRRSSRSRVVSRRCAGRGSHRPACSSGDGLLFGTPLGPSAAPPVEVRVRDAARQTASVSLPLVVRPAAAAGDATEWTPERLAEEHHAQAVAAHARPVWT